MDAIKCLKTRRSIRSFQDKDVSEDIIKDMAEMGALDDMAVLSETLVHVKKEGQKAELARTMIESGRVSSIPAATNLIKGLENEYLKYDLVKGMVEHSGSDGVEMAVGTLDSFHEKGPRNLVILSLAKSQGGPEALKRWSKVPSSEKEERISLLDSLGIAA